MSEFKKSGFGRNRNGGGFNRGGPSRPSFGGRPHGGRNDGFGRTQMFEAVCANCGKRCEVPFRPNGQKPVYCNDCFGKQDHVESRGGDFQRRDFGSRPPFRGAPQSQPVRDGRIDEIQRQLDAINVKLDRLLAVSKETPASIVASMDVSSSGEKDVKPAKVTKKKSVMKKRS